MQEYSEDLMKIKTVTSKGSVTVEQFSPGTLLIDTDGSGGEPSDASIKESIDFILNQIKVVSG